MTQVKPKVSGKADLSSEASSVRRSKLGFPILNHHEEVDMNMRDLIPWGRNNGSSPAHYGEPMSPFLSLHREMNRLFDDAFRSFDSPSLFGGMQTWPRIEVAERDKDMFVTAELPGMEENEVEVLLSDGYLIIRGEKKSETENKETRFTERAYGRFERRIPVDSDIDHNAVTANFKNGLLTVSVPRSESAQANTRRIPINNARN
jgi:HSP20 family protein